MNNAEDQALRTPAEWQSVTGVIVYDPDGWRMDGKDFNTPITFGEWSMRMQYSTCLIRNITNE